MSGDNPKIFHGYAQDGIEPLKSMMPQLGSRGTPPLSSAMPKASAAPATTAPAAPAAQSGSNSGSSK